MKREIIKSGWEAIVSGYEVLVEMNQYARTETETLRATLPVQRKAPRSTNFKIAQARLKPSPTNHNAYELASFVSFDFDTWETGSQQRDCDRIRLLAPKCLCFIVHSDVSTLATSVHLDPIRISFFDKILRCRYKDPGIAHLHLLSVRQEDRLRACLGSRLLVNLEYFNDFVIKHSSV
ncbi:predicted protein [Botrytis cinerea T4]|uniref:Uncharacterized protein n=1 Tax=Botryotinia fuckeliana (strain T4) TaxID=999810 RepID=G2YVT8_BOTF4|nr:predicted protein [Botrytis cinerea T4]